jgi:ankyrin repeat protein
LLVRKEIQINQAMNNGITPLYAACYIGHVKVINKLLVRKEIQINQAANDGVTPLLLLASKKIQINQATNNDCTPLFVIDISSRFKSITVSTFVSRSCVSAESMVGFMTASRNVI